MLPIQCLIGFKRLSKSSGGLHFYEIITSSLLNRKYWGYVIKIPVKSNKYKFLRSLIQNLFLVIKHKKSGIDKFVHDFIIHIIWNKNHFYSIQLWMIVIFIDFYASSLIFKVLLHFWWLYRHPTALDIAN